MDGKRLEGQNGYKKGGLFNCKSIVLQTEQSQFFAGNRDTKAKQVIEMKKKSDYATEEIVSFGVYGLKLGGENQFS